MRLPRCRSMLLAALLFAGTLSAYAPELFAQGAVVPSADQIEMFRTLSPDQQQAILNGISGGGGGSGRSDRGSRSTGDEGRQSGRDADTQRDRFQPDADNMQDEETQDGVPVLKAEDSVIIEVDFLLADAPAPAFSAMSQQGMPSGAAGQMNATSPPPAATPTPHNNASSITRAEPPPNLSAEQIKQREDLMALIRSRNPYQLSRDGALLLPGFFEIPLAGLTEQQATLRLRVEPRMLDLDVRVTRLPLRKTGSRALKPFGYDLFQRSPSTFAPVTNVPVPADYIIGTGDELSVQLYGNQNRTLTLIVGRDGRINFPELGPINVSGQLFSSVKASIESRVDQQMIGVRASVSMGDTRSIRVFVLGEARHPGSYTISGLGTITSALFAAGGVKPIGSLRTIQLKRQGRLVRQLDLYDLLIRGDTTDDTKLLPGDVIFVPPVGATVSVDGEVRRPAIYEINGASNAADVIQLAGGLTSEADTAKAAVTRIDEGGRRIVLRVDASLASARTQPMRNGDLLRIPRLRPTIDSGIALEGHVFAPGSFAYHEGMRLSDVLRTVDELKPNADIHYILIRRELPPDRKIVALSADLAAALKAPNSEADLLLLPRDRLTVFDLETGRDRIISPLLDELRLQSGIDRPTEVVRIDGHVKVPGEYPLEMGMTVGDLIRAGGNLTDSAYGGKAELTRYRVVDGEARRIDLINIDLMAVMRGDPAANILLSPFDNLSIKEVPDWGDEETVSLVGEVRFPGRYSIKRGETLKSVLARAGGLTEFAFPEGSVFTREDLKKREQQQLDKLTERLQSDLAMLALQGAAANQAQAGTAMAVGQSLLSQLRSSEAVGRLVINLMRTMREGMGSDADVLLHKGDQLMVPRFQQEVTVIGEVQNETSHLYRAELARDDYIDLSGGVTRKADVERTYVVRADGTVIADRGNRWFRSGSVDIRPGDTVVIPLDTERLPALPFWTAVTSIIYNLAISAAAVNSF